eukprot:SAG25_NODE_412_length_8295_cov_17.983895_6_plen_112_part_00
MATLIRPPGPTQGMGASDTGEQCKCLACGLAFDAMHTLKEHYRGDLHRCNLKRKVQGLLPLSAADFQSRAEELVALRYSPLVRRSAPANCPRKQGSVSSRKSGHAGSKRNC